MKATITSENKKEIQNQIVLTGSKSESNRLLVLQALYPNISIKNLSSSDDTVALLRGLEKQSGTIDVHHAGTAMRFLTAYFAANAGSEVILTGSKRMQERPIGILVDALRELGAQIEYQKEEGFPPLRIIGKELQKSSVRVAANISSQYISALLLIAPSMPKGLTLHLDGKITSLPYINMTLALLKNCGIAGVLDGNTVCVDPVEEIKDVEITVESDWSSASYFYSLVALSQNASVGLTSFKEESLQGDSELAEIYEAVGVKTQFHISENKISLSNTQFILPKQFKKDLSNTPDIAQTIAVTCLGLGIGCHLTGLHTLKIKETDRLLALKTEMEKLGAEVVITDDSLHLSPASDISENIKIDTYQDHRMAMAFAPLAVKVPIIINDSEVVSKSYPDFWADLAKLGLQVSLD